MYTVYLEDSASFVVSMLVGLIILKLVLFIVEQTQHSPSAFQESSKNYLSFFMNDIKFRLHQQLFQASTLIPDTLQYLAVCHFIFVWIVLPPITIVLPLYIILFTRYWWTMVLYGIWQIYDYSTPRRGSRKWLWYKNSIIWKYFADYFPLALVKTTDLPAS